MKAPVKTETPANPFSVREIVAPHRASSLFRLGLVVALLCSFGVLSTAHAQSSQGVTQDAAQASCATTASLTTPQKGSALQNNSSVQAQATNAENAAKQLGSLFKKKKASTPAASANPCPAPATSAPAASAAASAPTSDASVNAPAPAATPVAPADSSTPAAAEATSQAAAAPWTPPSGTPNAAPAAAGPLDPSKLPDISGLHLGMSLAEAKAFMQKWYPRGVGVMNGGPFGPQHQTAVGTFRATGDGRDVAGVDLTMPPNPQIVWHVSRNLIQPKVAHNVVVASLRQKFGKETYAATSGGRPITDDSEILQMWWLFDEQGHLVPQARMINGSPFGCGNFFNADGSFHAYQMVELGQDDGLSTYCHSSYVAVQAGISKDPILTDLYLDIVDLPLMVRSAMATAAWEKGMNDKARQEELQREKQAKPVL